MHNLVSEGRLSARLMLTVFPTDDTHSYSLPIRWRSQMLSVHALYVMRPTTSKITYIVIAAAGTRRCCGSGAAHSDHTSGQRSIANTTQFQQAAQVATDHFSTTCVTLIPTLTRFLPPAVVSSDTMHFLYLLSSLAALLSLAACQSAPYYLISQAVNEAGISTTMNFRSDSFTVTPASNNVAPSAAATTNLAQINHFIILMLNQESFDSVMGAYPKGNTLVNNPTPAPVKQTSDQQYAATPSTLPTFTTTGVFQYLPIDVGSQTPVNTPNAPWLFNYPRNTTLAQDPPHGWMQALYKLNGGKADGYVWSAETSGGLPMSHWDLTGSALWALAGNYTLFDHFFGSAFGGPLLAHIYLVGGQSVKWDNGNSSPPLILQDNATYTYHNYNTSNGILLDMNQEGILTYPDNYLVNNIHSPFFCGAPFFPYINDASNGTSPANLPDQLITAGISWAYYAQDWYNEEADANSSVTSNCKHVGFDGKLSANMAPLTHYYRFNPPLTSTASQQYLKDLDADFWTALANDALPAVSWVQPDKRFDWGIGDVDPYDSDVWLGNFTQTLFNSKEWKDNDTMLIVTWSGANGMYDHVPPYAGDRFGPGIRVPTIIASPFHTGGSINSNPYEHLSIIKMIQRRFGLSMRGGNGVNPIMAAGRDTATRDLTNSFNEAGAGAGSTAAAGTLSSSSSTGGGSNNNGTTNAASSVSTVSIVAVVAACIALFAAVM